jgi:cation/acetate symporter
MTDPRPLLAALGLTVTMLAVSWGVRRSTSTTLDFYLASRQVGPFLNACAICGDYFSAASFLGVAGAVYASGLDGVWFATGFAAGFVVVLLFLAAPFRRAGHFSIPDFLANRFSSPAVRLTAVAIVQLVVLLYLIPQLTGAGIIWEVFVGGGIGGISPYATGILLSVGAIVIQAVVGGMKGTTWNQALQFGLKMFTLFVITAIAVGHGFSYSDATEKVSQRPLGVPTEVTRAEAFRTDPEGRTTLELAGTVMSAKGHAAAVEKLQSGAPKVDLLLPADNQLHPGRRLRFMEPGFRYSLWQQIALIVTLLLGTAGLPHISNRYFTSTSGRGARISTVWVLGLAGVFYFFAVLLGVAARSDLPRWLGAGVTNADFVDSVVRVPEKALLLLTEQLGGPSLLALVSAAAFAAIFSTVAGLLLAAATSWGHDVYEQFVNPFASERRRIRFGQAAVTITATIAAAIGLALPNLTNTEAPSVALMVTWAFALAGSAFTPVFLLGVWWKRANSAGAIAGMAVGAVVSLAFIGTELLGRATGWPISTPVSNFPSIVAAPLAAAAVVGGSLLHEVREDSTAWWLRVHGTALERRQASLVRLAAKGGGVT